MRYFTSFSFFSWYWDFEFWCVFYMYRASYFRLAFHIFFFWLCWVFVAVHGLSLVVKSRGYSSLWCMGFSLQWLLLLQSTGSRHAGFSSCGTWAQQLWHASSRAQAQQLWCTGLVAPRHVGSSWARAQTHVPCIGRWILNHCATREAAFQILNSHLWPLIGQHRPAHKRCSSICRYIRGPHFLRIC